MTAGDPQAELLATIIQGVDAALSVIDEIETELLDCSTGLRVNPSVETFTALSAGVNNLGDFVSLMQEIRKGFTNLHNSPVPPEAVAVFAKSVDQFREMEAAMERNDWISLADLIQYEIAPIIEESKKELFSIKERLEQK